MNSIGTNKRTLNKKKTMKKTIKMMLALMAGAMAFTACSSDDILENNEIAQNASQLKPMTFTAVQEGQGGTRTAIDGLDIKWTAGDKISIFDGASENAGVQMFTLATGENSTSATFTGSAKEDAATYYALYPYAVGGASHTVDQAEAEAAAGSAARYLDWWKGYIEERREDRAQSDMTMRGISAENQAIILAFLKNEPIGTPGVQLDGSSIKNVVIPAEQTVAAGQTVDPKAMVMVAKGDDKDALQFKNVCAYVKVTPQFDCTAIGITSNGNEQLAGKVTVDCSGDTPTTTVTADGTNTVYLVGDITADNAYYIAVRPEALTSGFTIEFLTAGDKKYYARSTSKTLALARSNVKNLGEFATDGTWNYKDIVTCGTDNGHDWALLSIGGIKIATSLVPDNPVFAEIPDWGEGWELPSVADFESIYNNGFYYVWGTLTLKGNGILKYVVNTDITRNMNRLWTSTPDADPNKQLVFWTEYGTSDWQNKTSDSAVLFKYTK